MHITTWRPRQNCRHFADDIFKGIFWMKIIIFVWNFTEMCFSMFRINNIPVLVQITAWRRPWDKPLSEQIMFNSLTHICYWRICASLSVNQLTAYVLIDIWNIISIWNIHYVSILWWHTWWRHQMETFSALLATCAGNSPVPGEFPAQRPVTRSFDVFFDLHLNKRLSKQ